MLDWSWLDTLAIYLCSSARRWSTNKLSRHCNVSLLELFGRRPRWKGLDSKLSLCTICRLQMAAMWKRVGSDLLWIWHALQTAAVMHLKASQELAKDDNYWTIMRVLHTWALFQELMLRRHPWWKDWLHGYNGAMRLAQNAAAVNIIQYLFIFNDPCE